MKYAPKFTNHNANITDDYKRHLELNGLKTSTIHTKLWKIYTFLKFTDNKNADDITKREIEDYILYRRKNNKPKTVHNDIVDIRLFFNWLKPENNYFDGVKARSSRNRLPVNELIVQDDVKQMMAACKTQRDRALLMLTWDSAARISEILNLNVGSVQFDQYGATVIVDGKTGMRRIRLIDSVPDIQTWINQHPERDNPNAPLFVTIRKYGKEPRRLEVRTVQNMFKTVSKDAGIKKNVHPHAFRHGRLTELVKQGFKEMELRIIAGWEDESAMPATYIHLSGDDVDKKMLANHGLIEDDVKEAKEKLKPIECPRCKTRNPYDAKFCSQCSLVLDQKLAETIDDSSKPIEDGLTQLMESKINELVEARINAVLDNMSSVG